MRRRLQFSLRTLITSVMIAAVLLAVVVSSRNGDRIAFVCIFGRVLFSPVWAPPILMYQPPLKVRRLFRGIVLWTGLATLPSCLGVATDRFPYQFESFNVSSRIVLPALGVRPRVSCREHTLSTSGSS